VPTYAYACTACGHRFELQQSFTDSALTECPECAGRLRKLFNTVGIVFKGSGFYRTDSRGSGSGDKAADGAVKADAPSKDTSKESAGSSTSSSKESAGSTSSSSSSTSSPGSSSGSKAASSAA
jgi:putative FmdB family regulatory protein